MRANPIIFVMIDRTELEVDRLQAAKSSLDVRQTFVRFYDAVCASKIIEAKAAIPEQLI